MVQPLLDIVRSNPDITFPSDVQLHFVYWTHEDKNVPLIKDELQDSDAIAIELAHDPFTYATRDDEAVKVTHEIYRLLGDAIHKPRDKAAQNILRLSLTGKLGGHMLTAAKVARAAGKEGGRLVPVDTATITAHAIDEIPGMAAINQRVITTGSIESVLGNPKETAEFMSGREGLVIRQLAKLATSMSTDSGEIKKLTVLYGAKHSLLSVAARQLGANVTRTFINGAKPVLGNSDFEINYRSVRFGFEDELLKWVEKCALENPDAVQRIMLAAQQEAKDGKEFDLYKALRQVVRVEQEPAAATTGESSQKPQSLFKRLLRK